MLLSNVTLEDALLELDDIKEQLKNPNLSEIARITLEFDKGDVERLIEILYPNENL